jgi:hypothetical protein
MIKNFLVTLCTFAFFLFQSQNSHACFCSDFDAKISFLSAEVAFIGKVTEIRTSKKAKVVYSMPAVSDILKSRGNGRWEKSIDKVSIVKLEVIEPLKGITEKTFVLFTERYNGGGNCGVLFKTGKNYLVFANKTQSLLSKDKSMQPKASWTLEMRLEAEADKFNEQLPSYETDICAGTDRLSFMKEKLLEIRNFLKEGVWKEKKQLPTRVFY